MRNALWFLVSLLLFPVSGTRVFASSLSNRNLILITFDGVRYEDFFGQPDPALSPNDHAPILPWFWKNLAPTGIVFGNPASGRPMKVGNPHSISLPGYQGIFAGASQPCANNECPRIGVETFAERIEREGGLSKYQVATIASWDKIPLAVEHIPGTTFVNAAFTDFPASATKAPTGKADPELARLNLSQREQPPWKESRWDRFTYAFALRYLRANRPRFLFISFGDSDEWGHRGKYAEYLRSLRQYDSWLKELHETLSKMGAYGRNTCLIVTTDHGRGKLAEWNEHNSSIPNSSNVWLFTDCATGRADPKREYSHLDIRPTIESVFGLKPLSGAGRGTSMLPTSR